MFENADRPALERDGAGAAVGTTGPVEARHAVGKALGEPLTTRSKLAPRLVRHFFGIARCPTRLIRNGIEGTKRCPDPD